jgi:catechol 2,3-dioxygenase-like lactoylglutathione lyase family enzyme
MAIPIQRVVHVNVNCSDLERSLGFYRDFVGLTPMSHTRPVPQDGAGFGLEGEVQWDAHLLHDARGILAPAIDLLEWKRPRPTGRPYLAANHLGMFRVCLLVPDVDDVYARALQRGVPCESPPTRIPVIPEQDLVVKALFCRDPDGTLVEFIEQPGEVRLIHVNVNCRDLARSLDWYQRVLGLEIRGESHPGPIPGAPLGLEGDVEWDARFLFPPGQDAFAIDLLEWKSPRPMGSPYPCANHLGLYRMAFLVEDIRACQAELERLGVEATPPVFLDMGPDLPIAGVWALFFRDPDGTCLELIESPKLENRDFPDPARAR